jgi:hypothetical protein
MSKNFETRLNALEERAQRFKPVLIQNRQAKESLEAARARYKRLYGCGSTLVITYRRIGG